MERCMELFENSIKSKNSLEQYHYNLRKFLEFTGVKDHETLANLDSDTIQRFLEDYVIMLRKRELSCATIRSYLSGPELFFELNKKTIHKKILHKMIPEKVKGGSDKPYTTEEIQKCFWQLHQSVIERL
jgi:site-specific recombinase XerD